MIATLLTETEQRPVIKVAYLQSPASEMVVLPVLSTLKALLD